MRQWEMTTRSIQRRGLVGDEKSQRQRRRESSSRDRRSSTAEQAMIGREREIPRRRLYLRGQKQHTELVILTVQLGVVYFQRTPSSHAQIVTPQVQPTKLWSTVFDRNEIAVKSLDVWCASLLVTRPALPFAHDLLDRRFVSVWQ